MNTTSYTQYKNNKIKTSTRGFSLVEFIVILSLFAIMASVVSFDYQQYRTKIERSSFATDIALAFRQMQVYGISSSNRTIGGEGFEIDSGAVQGIVDQDLVLDVAVYGVQVDIPAQTLTLYQEVGGNNKAFDEGTDVIVDILQINSQNRILRICVTDTDQAADIDAVTGECASTLANPSTEINDGTFSVSFKRPFPDSRFFASSVPEDFQIKTAVIAVGTPNALGSELRYIYLDPIGLIQVSEPNLVNI